MNVWAIFLNYEYKYLHVYANKMNIHNIRKKSLDTSHGFVKSPQETDQVCTTLVQCEQMSDEAMKLPI